MNQPGDQPRQKSSAPIISRLCRLFAAKVTLARVEGREQNSRLPLAVWCGATRQNKVFLHQLLFAGEVRERALGKVELPEILMPNHGAEKDGSLIVLETKRPRPDWPEAARWFFIPGWVTGEVRLPIAESFLKKATLQSDLRKIRQNGLEFSVARGAKAFRDFYHHMHLPFIRRVHGAAAYFDPFAVRRRHFAKHDLLLVGRKNSAAPPAGGALIVYERAGPRLWSFGVRDGDDAPVRAGIVAAMYHFCFEHLQAKGFTRVSTGRSRAFLNNGVLRYKRKWSNTITGGSWTGYAPGFALRIISDTPATRAFLENNPFIFERDGALHAAVFTAAARPLPREYIEQIGGEYFYPGLASVVIHCFQPEQPAGPDTVPPALVGRVTIRPAGDVIGK